MSRFNQFKTDMLDMAGEALDDVRHTFERVMYGQQLTGDTPINSEISSPAVQAEPEQEEYNVNKAVG